MPEPNVFPICEIEKKLGYKFKNPSLLKAALTHPSAEKNGGKNYERLEFLGDSVLGLVVAAHLYESDGGQEGKLTFEKQKLVSTEPLSSVAKELGLGNYIIFGDSYKSGANRSSLENVYESTVAAIYLDGGIEESRAFIERTLLKKEKKLFKTTDFVSELQEFTQAKKMGTPRYEEVSRSGPDHDPLFTMAVSVNDKRLACGSGSSKKLANRKAAERALKKLKTGR